MPDPIRTLLALLVLGAVSALAGACGEPPLAIEVPARSGGRHVADLAGVLDADAVGARLRDLRDATGIDVVALLYEADDANCGEAFRAGGAIVEAWDADVAVVAVARPGGFEVADAGRERCVGVRARTERLVPAAVREEVAEELLPPLAREGRWDDVVVVAAERAAEAAAAAGGTDAGGDASPSSEGAASDEAAAA